MRRSFAPLLASLALLGVVLVAGFAIGGPSPRVEHKAAADPDAFEAPTPGEADRGGEQGGPGAETNAQDAYPRDYVEDTRAQAALRSFDRLPEDSAITTPWQPVGPEAITKPPSQNYGSPPLQAGRVTALAVAPSCDPGNCRVWMAAAGGGVWTTPDALATPVHWTPSNDGIDSQAIGALAVDPNDPSGNTLYAGSGEENASHDSEIGTGLYKSTDGGQSWHVLPGSVPFARGRSIGAIAIKPGDSNTIWFGTSRGRHGWSATIGDTGGDYTPPNAPAMGVYKSTNGGSTFSAALVKDPSSGDPANRADTPRGGVNHLEIDPSDPDTVYAALFGYGIWRQSQAHDGDTSWHQVYAPAAPTAAGRVEFALVTSAGHTRVYVGDGSDNPGGVVFRVDNADVPAGDLVDPSSGVNQPVWQALSSPTDTDPGFASYLYCASQCGYDNVLIADRAHPDTVWIAGVAFYNDVGFSAAGTANRSNGRSVMRSTDAGVTFRDATNGADDPVYNGSHPDLHAIALSPTDPNVAFVGSDGGVVRTDPPWVDGSSVCSSPTRSLGTSPLSPANQALCQTWLADIPQHVTGMNDGLATLQFQTTLPSPQDPANELIGGTQDNGTMKTGGDPVWTGVAQGDGGAAGFDVSDPSVRVHTFTNSSVEVSYQNGNDSTWLTIGQPLTGENTFFYSPMVSDPVQGGTMFFGMERVWRTVDNGGDRSELEAHCKSTQEDGSITCGDWAPLGASKLTSTGYGTTKQGSAVSALARAPSDTGTLWAATGTGRLFVSKNADAAANLVTFTRIDDGVTAAPGRFPSGIAVDPTDPNRAWVSFSGYNAYTPSTPGHVFEIEFDPDTGTATWTDRSYDLGDEVVRDVAYDPDTGDLYAASDFGVARLAAGSTHWSDAAPGLPPAGITDLTLAPGTRLLYAATHGRSAYRLDLPSPPGPPPAPPGPEPVPSTSGGGSTQTTPSGGGAPVVPGTGPATRALGIDVLRRNRRVRVGRGGVFTFVLGPQDVDAFGRIGFNASVPRRALAAKRIVLAAKTFVSTAERNTVIRVRLSARQLRALRAAKKLRVTARIVAEDRSGNAVRRNYGFTLLPPRKLRR